MAKYKYFGGRRHEDFVIKEGPSNRKIGTLRVRPTGILWADKGKHSWRGVSIERFAEFISTEGKPLKH